MGLPECIDALDQMDEGVYTSSLLLKFADENPVIADAIRRTYHNKAHAEQTKVISFDSYSSRVWHYTNTDYRSLRASAQSKMAGDVYLEVQSDIAEIGEQAGQSPASFGTKKSALETLRKIGKTVILSGDTIGHRVRKRFQADGTFGNAMLQIVGKLN
jgi:hypothetical protein